MRPLIAVLLAGSVGLYFVYGRNKADAPAGEPAAQLKDIRKKFNEELDGLQKRFQAAETPAEVKGIRAEAKEAAVLTAGKVRKLVEGNPKDPAVVDAAGFVLGNLAPLGADGPDVDAVIGAVADHHLADRKLKDLVQLAPQVGPAGEKLLEAVAEKSPDKDTQALALYFLGTLTGEKADGEADEAKSVALYAKAVEYLGKAAKAAPDLPLGEEKLGKAAEAEIATFQTLIPGKPAPEVEGTTLDGKPARLADYKGKVVLLDFWFTGCPPCRAMIPHERELVGKLKGRPFELLSVSSDGEKDDLKRFLDKTPMPWAHWYDGPDGKVGKAYRVKAFPTLYLIDAKGVIRKRWVGLPGNDPKSTVVDEAVDKLLKEVG